MAFDEVRFPIAIALGSRGGPQRRTIVATSGSGWEHRNSQWADSRRKFNAGSGVKSYDDIQNVISFWEERRGMVNGFRWKDFSDFKSCSPSANISPIDQQIGVGNGALKTFQLTKKYGNVLNPYYRVIKKPVAGTIQVSINNVTQSSGWSIDTTTGILTFVNAPANNAIIKAGFEFDVPVRFDTDYLEFNLDALEIGQVPSIPIIEIRV